MEKEYEEKLIRVVKSLTGDCITNQTAVKIISEIIAVGDRPVDISYQEKIDGLKDLMKLNLLPEEEGLSYVKEVLGKQLHEELKGSRKKGGLGEPTKHINQPYGTAKPQRFRNGELQNTVVEAIEKNNKTARAIQIFVAERFGMNLSSLDGTIPATLKNLYKNGTVDRVVGEDGVFHYEVLQFKDMKQAGVETFQSVKEIKRELGEVSA
jgi:hypothetical protein